MKQRILVGRVVAGLSALPVLALPAAGWVGPAPPAPSPRPLADRAYWLSTLLRVVEPVLAGAAGRRQAIMPIESAAGQQDGRRAVTHPEALGGTLTGLAPWLELPAARRRAGDLRALGRQRPPGDGAENYQPRPRLEYDALRGAYIGAYPPAQLHHRPDAARAKGRGKSRPPRRYFTPVLAGRRAGNLPRPRPGMPTSASLPSGWRRPWPWLLSKNTQRRPYPRLAANAAQAACRGQVRRWSLTKPAVWSRA